MDSIQTLRSAYSHSPERFYPQMLSCPLAQIQGYKKLAQTYLNQQASCRQQLLKQKFHMRNRGAVEEINDLV